MANLMNENSSSRTWISAMINVLFVSGIHPIWSAIYPRKATCIDEQGTQNLEIYVFLFCLQHSYVTYPITITTKNLNICFN